MMVMGHPFYDGNGRTARILTNLLLIAFGYPPFWIKPDERAPYNQYIADIQGYGGNPDLFFGFATSLIIRSQQIVLDAIEAKDIDDEDDLDKRIELIKMRLNSPDVVIQPKSLHSTNEALRLSFFPLLQRVEAKLEKFKDLFQYVDRRMEFVEDGIRSNLESNDTQWDNIYNTWLKNRTPQKEGINLNGIDEFTFIYQLKGFKKSLKLQYYNIYLSIDFREFEYVIQKKQVREYKFAYGQLLDNQTSNKIVNEILNGILNEIEGAIE